MRTVIPLVALVAASPPALTAQEVLLRMKPPQGQVTRYLLVSETFLDGGPMAAMAADPEAPFMRMRMSQTWTVTASAGDEFTVRQVVDSAGVETPAMPQMEATMSQVGEMLRGFESVTRMTGRGEILSAELTVPPAMKSMMESQGAGLGAGSIGMGGNAGNMPGYVLLPVDPVRVGSTWRDSVTMNLDWAGLSGVSSSFAVTYALKRLVGRVAVIGVDGTLAGGPPSMASNFTATGEVELDLDAGRATRMRMDMSGVVSAATDEIPMRMRTTMIIQ